AVNNPFLVSSKRAKSDSESHSDGSNSSSEHAKSDSELLSDEKSDSKAPSNGSDLSWKPDECEEDGTEEDEDDKIEKQKAMIFYFVGPADIETNVSKIQNKNDGHIIDGKLWDSAIQQVYQEYPLPDLPDNWLSKCNEMAKEVELFVFLKIKYSIRANEALDSSAHRKKKFDPSLEPDFAVYASANQERENLLIAEIKPLIHKSPNKNTLNDLVKLGNELKYCIDKMVDDGIYDNVPVCGILVEGK
ncbi:7331_t:CDS:2, partial [Racocetra fulgida]